MRNSIMTKNQKGPPFAGYPFYPISEFYKARFGEKVFKIPVAFSGRCPNLKDLKKTKPCIFCDQWGSFAYPENRQKSLKNQIENHKRQVAVRYNSKKFFVYFQAYTTTYMQIKKIKEAFDTALNYEDVVGLIVGTRPDCLSPALLDIFNDVSKKSFMGLELGVQSFDDKQLRWMKRGHSTRQSVKAIRRIKNRCPRVNLGIHLIFGWPGETREDIIQAAMFCNQLKIDNVKLHNLHVLKGTTLAEIHRRGEFTPIDLKKYAGYVGTFLSYLSSKIAIHRLVATASRWDELISPLWTRNKMKNYQYMLDYLLKNRIYQGQCCETF